jgi:hypothetical protein
VVLVPEAKILAVVPTRKRDQLVLYRADVDKALTTADFDFLVVASRPPTEAVKGAIYRYTATISAKKGGVKVALEIGPKGMKVTPDGAVSWDVPKDFADSEVRVSLKVTDNSRRELFHTFRLVVRAAGKGDPIAK